MNLLRQLAARLLTAFSPHPQTRRPRRSHMNPLHQAILCAFQPLEQRLLMTTLYYDTSAASGLQAGNGTWDTSTAIWNTAADGTGSRVAFTNGDNAVFAANGSSTVTISSAISPNSVTVTGTGYTITGGTLYLSGTLSISTGLILNHVDVQNSGTISWTGGDFYLANASDVANSGTITLDAGTHTLTLDGSSLNNNAATQWDSGLVVLTDEAALINDSAHSATFTIGTGNTVTLDVADDSSLTGTITNHGTLHWAGDDTSQLDAIDDSGTIILDGQRTLYWDTSATTGLQAGNGTWDFSAANWNIAADGTGHRFAFTNGDDAVFVTNGTSTVTIASSIAAHAVTFSGTGYTVAGGSLSVSQEIFVGANAAISATVDGASVDGITGGVTLTLSGADTTISDISGGVTVTFVDDALTALPGADLTLGTYGSGTLSITGTVAWTDSNVTAYSSAVIGITGDVTLSGGTWSLASTCILYNYGTLTIDGGDLTLYRLENYGDLALSAGSLTLAGGWPTNHSGASITWSGGDFAISGGTFTNWGDFTIDGGSNSLSLGGAGTLDNHAGTIHWTSGNLSVTVDIANEYGGTITLDGGSDTLTGLNLTNDHSAALTWTSGALAQFTIENHDENYATATIVGYSTTGSGTSLEGTVPSAGVLHWAGSDLTSLENVTNAGTILFVDDVDLSGLTLTGGTYELTSGNTADIASTLTVTGAIFTVDAGATLEWSAGNLSIGTAGVVNNHGTLTITTTGAFAGTVGVAGFHDFSSLASGVTSAIDTLLDAFTTLPDFTGSGPAYSWQEVVNIFNNDTYHTHNTSGWWGDVDLTAIPQSGGHNGVLITPRDMIFANHSPPAMYDVITFLGNNGTTYQRQVVKIAASSIGGDILVVTLGAYNGSDIDLPSAYVTPFKLLPSNFRDYELNPYQAIPVAFTNQDHTLLVGKYGGTSGNYSVITAPTESPYDQFYYPVRDQDSGSPSMMFINGEAVLITNWYGASYGPTDADFISEINTTIAANATALSRITYTTVSTVNLSGFTNYSALLS